MAVHLLYYATTDISILKKITFFVSVVPLISIFKSFLNKTNSQNVLYITNYMTLDSFTYNF